jgi:hypothetical protein
LLVVVVVLLVSGCFSLAPTSTPTLSLSPPLPFPSLPLMLPVLESISIRQIRSNYYCSKRRRALATTLSQELLYELGDPLAEKAMEASDRFKAAYEEWMNCSSFEGRRDVFEEFLLLAGHAVFLREFGWIQVLEVVLQQEESAEEIKEWKLHIDPPLANYSFLRHLSRDSSLFPTLQEKVLDLIGRYGGDC